VARPFKKDGTKGGLSREVVLIFVTIGTADKGIEFTRLIVAMDEIAGKIEEEVIMQIGSIEYKPKHAQYFRYTTFVKALSFFQRATLVVGHGGTGTILNALRFEVPLILVPRRIQYGELDRDDHQLEIAQRLEGRGWVEVVYDMEELESKVMQMIREKRKFLAEKVSPERKRLIQFLKEFIEQGGRKAG
jgi:beta-1,4-N-acetylglucosaminyltransferase